MALPCLKAFATDVAALSTQNFSGNRCYYSELLHYVTKEDFPMRALFMRHGHTNYNQLGLCNDDPRIDVYLTPTGIAQAQTAAQQLKTTPLELIVTSALPRTQQTAAIINQPHQIPIQVCPGINDIRSGFEGRPVSEYFAAIAADPLQMAVNGGESLLQHRMRVLPYLDWLHQQHQAVILTIAHEETLRVFYAHFHQLPAQQLRALHFGNCEVFEHTW
jgi:alpha-ribazole phosphatase